MSNTTNFNRSKSKGESFHFTNFLNSSTLAADPRQPKPDTSETDALSFSLDTVARLRIQDCQPDVLSLYLSKQLKKSARLENRAENKRLFEIKLRKLGFIEEADKFKKCCANYTALVCANGHSFRPIVDFRCHLPFCADCSEQKAHRELSRNLPKILQALKNDSSLIVAFCTLTLRSDKKRSLKRGNRKLKADFKRLREREIFNNCVGGLGRIENTFSPKLGYKPHIHSILLLKNYIPQKFLSDAWQSITGDSKIVDIRTVKDIASGLVECLKYPYKPADLLKLGKEEIQEMLDAKGERLGLSFGCLFGIEIESDIEEKSELLGEYHEFIEESKNLEIGDCCPICQTKLDLIDFTAKGYSSFLKSVPIQARTE